MNMLSIAQVKRNEELLATLLPEVAAKVRRVLMSLDAEGLYFFISLAYRTVWEQDAIFAQGRTRPGKVVTNARGGMSWHNFRRAADLVLMGENGEPVWADPAAYARLGEVAKWLGFAWGGDFHYLKDYGHIEYHPGLTLADARTHAGIKERDIPLSGEIKEA
jgi:peptidoglycan L-alanyl-D-glutamate endopeptidase CwlK